MTLAEARTMIGRPVLYEPSITEDGRMERGVITDVGEVYVFVRYDGQSGSKATRAEDLTPDGIDDMERLTDEDWAEMRRALETD